MESEKQMEMLKQSGYDYMQVNVLEHIISWLRFGHLLQGWMMDKECPERGTCPSMDILTGIFLFRENRLFMSDYDTY
ncbi:hypothetical protein K250101E9_40160 [Enterocloster aldenensis]